VGRFERLGQDDGIAFVCDFCDGYLVWPDLREMPSSRRPTRDGLEPQSATSVHAATQDNWQAIGFSASDETEKNIVFAPVAIANHMPPEPGDWQAALLCPYCDDYVSYEQGDEDMDAVKWNQDEAGFQSVKEFQEHLEWSHGAPSTATSTNNCVVM
jgi:hypothetical protein